jgi:hypothetical protein
MGCGILYRMVEEQIGLSATLATRRTGWLLCWGDRRSERDDNFIVPVDGLVTGGGVALILSSYLSYRHRCSHMRPPPLLEVQFDCCVRNLPPRLNA